MKGLKKIAAYIRLSREDYQKGESESVENQRYLLKDYIKKHLFEDNFIEYIDDGFSGTNFNRPAFSRLIEDIERGEISTVVVKDLSRLGREYIETGHYLERYFPMKGIRFIAVNDHIDSRETLAGMGNEGLIVAFKNIINDEYARDISIKVKSALRARKRNGIFACAFAPFGYMKGENGALTVNESEAGAVRMIFELRAYGMGIEKIAQRLNGLKIDAPCGRDERGNKLWNYQKVYRILKNPIYLGCAHLAKTQTINHKLKKSIKTSKENIIFFDAPPIIMKTKLGENDLDVQNSRKTVKDRPFYCAECKAAMQKKSGAKEQYYVCGNYRKNGAEYCASHFIKVDTLDQIYRLILFLVSGKRIKLKLVRPKQKEGSVSKTFILIKKNEDMEAYSYESGNERKYIKSCKKINKMTKITKKKNDNYSEMWNSTKKILVLSKKEIICIIEQKNLQMT